MKYWLLELENENTGLAYQLKKCLNIQTKMHAMQYCRLAEINTLSMSVFADGGKVAQTFILIHSSEIDAPGKSFEPTVIHNSDGLNKRSNLSNLDVGSDKIDEVFNIMGIVED